MGEYKRKMGCCEFRNVIPNQTSYSNNSKVLACDSFSHLNILDQTFKLGIKSMLNIGDEFSMDLLLYLELLESDSEWEPIDEGVNFEIKQIETSKYSEKAPMNYVLVNFDSKIPIDILIRAFQDPVTRLSWDTRVKELETIEGKKLEDSVIYTVIEEDFYYKGDFVERKIMGTYKNRFIIILYSVEHEQKQNLNTHCRGANHFTVYIFSYLDNSMQLKIVSQVDQNSILAKMNLDQSPKKLLKWARSYESAALSLIVTK